MQRQTALADIPHPGRGELAGQVPGVPGIGDLHQSGQAPVVKGNAGRRRGLPSRVLELSGETTVATAGAPRQQAAGNDLTEVSHPGAIPNLLEGLLRDVAGHDVQTGRDGAVGQNPAAGPQGVADLLGRVIQVQVIGLKLFQRQVRQAG